MAYYSRKENPLKCAYCEHSIDDLRHFSCKKCRKSPLCIEHLDREYKTCTACAAEKRIRLYHDLQAQEKSLKGFLRLTQFIFLFVAVLFTASRIFPEHFPDYLKGSVFFEYIYLWGTLSALTMLIIYFLRSSQRRKIDKLDQTIRGQEMRQKQSYY
jgi:hypothetical protein